MKMLERHTELFFHAPFDAVHDALKLQDQANKEGLTAIGGIIWQVLDVADAYWLFPLHPDERRFQCASWRGRIIVFKRIAQGDKGFQPHLVPYQRSHQPVAAVPLPA